MDRLLWYLFAGSRGGPTRVRILNAILDRPQNLNQLAKLLSLDYKTIEYNLRVLLKHVVVVVDRPGEYGALYHPSKNFLAHRDTFETILTKILPVAPAKGSPDATWEKPEIAPDRR